MRDKKRVLVLVLLILSITCIVYLTSFKLNAFSEKFYSKEFKKYSIYGEFPDNDIDKINYELLLYLKGEKDDFNKELFNEREVEHLRDVKVLISGVDVFYYLILIISIFLMVILFLLNKRYFLKDLSFILFFSGLFTLFIGFVLLIFILLNFSGIFTVFHNIFFPQGNWLFSASDNIIRLYPSGFFYDMAKRMFISVIFYGNILIGVAILLFLVKND